jgi:hypothetical protein
MGGFMAMTAFRTPDADAVLAATRDFLISRGCGAEAVDPGNLSLDTLEVFPSIGGWVVVAWPYRCSAYGVAPAVSARAGCVASDVSIHDGDCWSHTLLRDGETSDQFCSMPEYFSDDPDEIAEEIRRYAGDPQAVAEAAGRPVEDVAPYFVRTIIDEEGETVSPTGKAFPDDEFDLDDVDVLYDFWARLGVTYPDEGHTGIGCLRLTGDWRDVMSTPA